MPSTHNKTTAVAIYNERVEIRGMIAMPMAADADNIIAGDDDDDDSDVGGGNRFSFRQTSNSFIMGIDDNNTS